MSAAGINKLPFGNLPRLILAWICTEVVKTRSREVVLGKSLADFMRSLDVYSSSGGKYTRLRNQMKRLFGIVKLTGCRAASRPIEYSGVVLLTISWGCLSW